MQRRTFHTLTVLLTAALATSAMGQAGGDKAQMLQKLKASAAENKQKLQQYSWVETRQLTLKGDAKPPQSFSCQYGPDGRVQKTSLGAPPAAPAKQGGKLRQRMVEKKTDEMK